MSLGLLAGFSGQVEEGPVRAVPGRGLGRHAAVLLGADLGGMAAANLDSCDQTPATQRSVNGTFTYD